MEGLEDVSRGLEAKRQQLANELESARSKAAEIEQDLKRVDEALASLTGKKPKAKSRAKKHAPTLEEVREIVACVRTEEPYAASAELEKAVRARAKKKGWSLTGFGELYAQTLAEAVDVPGGEALGEPMDSIGDVLGDVLGDDGEDPMSPGGFLQAG